MRRLNQIELAKERRKRCSHCELIKPFTKFYLYSSGKYSSRCKSCEIQRVSTFNRTAYGRSLHRAANTMYRFGLTAEEAAELKSRGCEVCLKTQDELPGESKLGHDHSHVTGKLRGVLCTYDNFLVGLLENGRLMKPSMRTHKAMEYLYKHRN